MNILYINHYAGSPSMGMEFRNYYLSKYWKSRGNKVINLAASYTHLRIKNPFISKSLDKIHVFDNCDFLFIKVNGYQGNGLLRLLNIFTFVTKCLLLNNRISSFIKPDIVICSSTYPLDIFIGLLFKFKFKSKVIFEVHDLWPLSLTELAGLSRYNPFVLINKIAEYVAYKYSDKIISMLSNLYDYVSKFNINSSKIIIATNGVDHDEWVNSFNDSSLFLSDLIKDLRYKYKYLCAYTGAIGEPNALHSLVETAFELKNYKIAFLIVGNGSLRSSIIERNSCLGNDNVFFCEPIKKSQIPSFLKLVDFGYIGAQKKSIYRYGISPNKMFDYMMAELPIICAIDSVNNPVQIANAGICVESENKDEIVDAFKTLMDKSQNELEIIGKNGKFYVEHNSTYEIISNRLLTFLES